MGWNPHPLGWRHLVLEILDPLISRTITNVMSYSNKKNYTRLEFLLQISERQITCDRQLCQKLSFLLM